MIDIIIIFVTVCLVGLFVVKYVDCLDRRESIKRIWSAGKESQ